MPHATKMTESDELVAATHILLAAMASSFGRVATTMHETSVRLADASERIRSALPPRRAS